MIVRPNVTKNADLYGIHGWKVVASLKGSLQSWGGTVACRIHGWKVVASLKEGEGVSRAKLVERRIHGWKVVASLKGARTEAPVGG